MDLPSSASVSSSLASSTATTFSSANRRPSYRKAAWRSRGCSPSLDQPRQAAGKAHCAGNAACPSARLREPATERRYRRRTCSYSALQQSAGASGPAAARRHDRPRAGSAAAAAVNQSNTRRRACTEGAGAGGRRRARTRTPPAKGISSSHGNLVGGSKKRDKDGSPDKANELDPVYLAIKQASTMYGKNKDGTPIAKGQRSQDGGDSRPDSGIDGGGGAAARVRSKSPPQSTAARRRSQLNSQPSVSSGAGSSTGAPPGTADDDGDYIGSDYPGRPNNMRLASQGNQLQVAASLPQGHKKRSSERGPALGAQLKSLSLDTSMSSNSLTAPVLANRRTSTRPLVSARGDATASNLGGLRPPALGIAPRLASLETSTDETEPRSSTSCSPSPSPLRLVAPRSVSSAGGAAQRQVPVVDERPVRVSHNLNLSDGVNVLPLTCNQIVHANMAHQRDGYVLIRTEKDDLAMCPWQYLELQ